MTRLKQARIALYTVALANVVLVAVSWSHPSTLTELLTLIVCGGSLLIAYRENPATFHRKVSRSRALQAITALMVLVGLTVTLSTTHLL